MYELNRVINIHLWFKLHLTSHCISLIMLPQCSYWIFRKADRMENAIQSADKLFKYGFKLSKKHSAYLSASAAKDQLNLDAYMSSDSD